MKAHYVEACGVYIGMVVPCMGGLLVKPSGVPGIGWTWGYGGTIDAVERIRKEIACGKR